MRIRPLFLLPALILSSCSQKVEEVKEPEPAPKKEETPPEPEEPAPAPPPVDPGLTFAVADSTNELMTDEKKKTVVGPVAPPKVDTDNSEDGVISVDPPKVPEAKLPDEE